MTESIVSLVVETLGSLIRDEVVLQKNFHKELERIKVEFQRIQAFLKDADTKGEMEGGEQVKIWLQQLRHVAFDIEDLLEEYLFRYHKQHLHVRGYGTCGFIYRIKNFLHKYLCQRHKLARQIEDIKCRLEEIFKGKEKYKFDESPVASTSRTIRRESRNPQDDALFLDDDKVVGIDENKSKLVTRLITGEPSLGVSCVFGQGGVGKTTLVKKVYENQQIKSHFSIHGWIVVSQSYDSNHLLKELILATIKEDEKKNKISQLEGMEARKLKEELHNYYQGRRYLVVMDDIWDIAAWKEIKSALPDSGCGSRIMVTTRSKGITDYCQENSGVVFKVEPLSEDDSLSLFQKMAAKSDVLKSNCSIDQHTKKVILKFLHKCGGLPLAIVAIAGLLSTKHTIVEWERIYTDNGSLLSRPELGDVNIILSLSYNDLSYHLKSCLLYLCMFPEDHLINCSRLLQLWAAEGFCESNTDDITKEDKAEEYLDELIARSLIQVQYYYGLFGRPSSCRIHDLLRDFILKKARDQEFAECLRGDETNSGRLRRVSFLDAEAKNHNTLSSSLRQIRSLLMFGSDITASTVSTIICGGGINLLKVLHLEDASFAEFPGKDVTANLIFLRYLRLDLNERLETLPSYLGKLVYLETLHLVSSYTFVCEVELPDEILKLTRLRNLICEGSYSFVLPKEIGRLSALENLYIVDGSRGIDGAELGKLTRLRSLKIRDLHEEDATAVLASVEKMKHLRLLEIFGDIDSIFSFEEKCPPPPMLQYLLLWARMKGGISTAWILSLERLQSLELCQCKITEESFFEGLQLRLTNLVTLRLQADAIEVEEWCFLPRSFPKLRTLELLNLFKLKLIKVEEGAMPCIKTIHFSVCPKLKNVPTGIEHLTTLKDISLYEMSKHFEMAIRSHCWKAGHSPAIDARRSIEQVILLFENKMAYVFLHVYLLTKFGLVYCCWVIT